MNTLRIVVLLGLLASAGCDSAPPRQEPAAVPVIVETASRRDLTEDRPFTGRIEAIDKVQIRAKVTGYIKARHFNEGSVVEAGALLFEIEPDPFDIAVQQAEANLASARAALTLAEQTLERTDELAGRNVSSKATLDQARAAAQQAAATVRAREADLQNAKLNLGYTKIVAPMGGRLGRAAFSVGNLVGPDSGALVTLVKETPVYVTFPVPNWLLLQVRKEHLPSDGVVVRLRLADDTMYEPVGSISFAEVQATASTDSVIVRATIPNPRGLLTDQQLVSVLVVRKQPERKLVISQSALLLDQQGPYVLAVGSGEKVELKRIKTGEQRGPIIVVESGLAEGDRVIVSGQQKVRPGAVVVASVAKPAEGIVPPAANKR